jgi:hypothetical protein
MHFNPNLHESETTNSKPEASVEQVKNVLENILSSDKLNSLFEANDKRKQLSTKSKQINISVIEPALNRLHRSIDLTQNENQEIFTEKSKMDSKKGRIMSFSEHIFNFSSFQQIYIHNVFAKHNGRSQK